MERFASRRLPSPRAREQHPSAKRDFEGFGRIKAMNELKTWSKGGTLVTKFAKERLPLYQKAIDQYKGPANLYLSGCELHCSTPFPQDLSGFWEIFRDLDELERGVMNHVL
jgi:hypothetical protein